MTAPRIPEHDPLIPVLQVLIEQLSAPGLTADEANDLRPRLLGVVDAIQSRRSTAPDDESFARDARRRCFA